MTIQSGSKEERDKLGEIKLENFAKMEERQVNVGETVYAIHYGGRDNNRKM